MRRLIVPVLSSALAAAALTGCSDDRPGSATTPPAADTGAGSPPPAAAVALGRELFRRQGCYGCHSDEPGVRSTGPSVVGLAGREVTLADGSRVVADRDYLTRSILEPAAQIVEGFHNEMVSYRGLLTEDEIRALVAYIESLGSTPGA